MANKIEEYIYSVLDALDKTGANTERYRKYFEGLSEEEFKAAIKDYLTDPSDHFHIEMDSFENNITIEEINEAAKIANVLIEDHLVLPHISDDPDNPYVTNEKVMVGYINQRRVQQTLGLKNNTSISIDKRNPKVDQVISEDKSARVPDMQMFQLISHGSHNVITEMFTARSDDSVMKNEMLYQIQRKGSVSLDELPNQAKNKAALNYLNFLLLAAGYESDLIDDTGLLPIVVDRGGQLYDE